MSKPILSFTGAKSAFTYQKCVSQPNKNGSSSNLTTFTTPRQRSTAVITFLKTHQFCEKTSHYFSQYPRTNNIFHISPKPFSVIKNALLPIEIITRGIKIALLRIKINFPPNKICFYREKIIFYQVETTFAALKPTFTKSKQRSTLKKNQNYLSRNRSKFRKTTKKFLKTNMQPKTLAPTNSDKQLKYPQHKKHEPKP